jgi:AAA+ superfamily predicted ATPase
VSTEAAKLARSEYDLQLHAALLRTMRAVLDAEREQRGREHAAGPALDDELGTIEASIAELPDDARGRPMLALARRLRWSQHEIGFVWTTVALGVNPRLLVHARALDDIAMRGMTASLYARIAGLDPPAARDLGLTFVPGVGGARAGLITPAPGEWVASATPWLASPELVRHLAGLPGSDPRLVDIDRPPGEIVLDAAQRAAVERLAGILAVTRPLVVHVEGPPLTGRRTAVALATSQAALSLDLGHLAPTAAALTDALVALRREAALRGAVPVIAGVEELMSSGEGGRDARVRVLGQHLDGADGPMVLVTSWRGLDAGTRLPTVRVEWPTPDVSTRARLWRTLVPGIADGDPEQMAIRFPIGAGHIRRALASARVLAGNRPADAPLSLVELTGGVRQNIAESMGEVAERVVVRQSWNDLVLSDDVLAQVKTLVGRVRHAHQVYEEWGYRSKMPRGVGVAAMFSGPPGTGKTMVAGLIARELELELYQVDLSKVVSKWVGETEKQLARVFDAAEAGHVLLLFDEADALFGQRTKDVQSATDRYANLEVNFLLQRIESFDGTVILTTNLDTGIDKAVKRRLAAHVVFQHPDDEERARLWEHMLSAAAAPLDANLDHHDLARRFPTMTGANIRNAALGAAFLAASQRRKTIDQATAIAAGRHEYLSMGHILATSQGL